MKGKIVVGILLIILGFFNLIDVWTNWLWEGWIFINFFVIFLILGINKLEERED